MDPICTLCSGDARGRVNYSAVQINIVKRCVITAAVHATSGHLYLNSSVQSERFEVRGAERSYLFVDEAVSYARTHALTQAHHMLHCQASKSAILV